jgi:hypothetical protein
MENKTLNKDAWDSKHTKKSGRNTTVTACVHLYVMVLHAQQMILILCDFVYLFMVSTLE